MTKQNLLSLSEKSRHKYLWNLELEFSWYTLFLIAILLLAFLLRFYHLDGKSLWVDEIGQVIASQSGMFATIKNASLHFGAVPFDYLLTNLILHTGHSEFALRLPSAIEGVITVFLTYQFTTLTFTSQSIGLLSALLLALCPAHIEFSQEVRWYSLSCMLAVLSSLIYTKAILTKKTTYWILLGIVFAISVATATYQIFVIFSLGFSLLIFYGRDFLYRKITVDSGDIHAKAQKKKDFIFFHIDHSDVLQFFATLVFPLSFIFYWYLSGLIRKDASHQFNFESVPLDVLVTYPIMGIYDTPLKPWPFPYSFLGPILFPLLAVIGLVSSWLQHKKKAIIPILIILIVAPGILLVDYLFSYFWAYRQYLIIVPFYITLIAAGIVFSSQFARKYPVLQMLLVCSAGFTIGYMTISQVVAYYNFPKTNWRDTALLLDRAAADRNSIVIFSDELQPYILYYQPTIKNKLQSLSVLDDLASRPFDEKQRLWYSGPIEKLSSIEKDGGHFLNVSVDASIPVYYVGKQDIAVLYKELINFGLPPQVLTNGFLYGLAQVDRKLALDLGERTAESLNMTFFPLSNKEKTDVLTVIGRVHFDAGQTDKGFAYLNEALKYDKTSQDGYTNLGYFYMSTGSQDKAIDALSKSVQYHPRNYWGYVFLANIYKNEQQWAKAAEIYLDAYEYAYDPGAKPAHLVESIDAYLKSGNKKKAEAIFELLDNKFPNSPEVPRLKNILKAK